MKARPTAFTALLVMALALVRPAAGLAWIDDQNLNRIDDRIEQVNLGGIAAAFLNGNLNDRMIIAVFDDVPVRFGVYVGYDHHPGVADLDALTAVGAPFTRPYLYIDYVRTELSFAQVLAVSALPGVTRVEAIPMMYPTNHYGTRVVRARDSRGLSADQNYVLFPSARQDLGLDGTGTVVAILDTGVNDAPDMINPLYPGHESLAGKFLGGGNFFAGQPLLNTPLTSSENPQDHGGEASSLHATHVAGTSIGSGGPTGFFRGVAPEARLVDCKVLSDAGVGFGSADGVEWCIYNRFNSWGLTGPDTIYAGIDVLSLSLGGTSASDGTDAGALMMNAAVNAGLAVCVATGNDGNTDYIASPAAADSVIAVGASSHGQTLDPADDAVTDFSNEGPRTDDGDLDHVDEMKPSIVTPGAGIVSADGDPLLSDGTKYKPLSGTSMATPMASGCVALIRQANPTLTPLQIRDILQNTAIHNILSVKGDRPNDPFGLDPNFDPGCGWGLIDVYAAAKEAMNSTDGIQVVRFRPVARPLDGEVDVHWWTQREYASQGFDVYRAPDVSGLPGAFAQINPVRLAAVGHPDIEGASNRTPYVYVDGDPALSPGQTYWYRVAWVDPMGTSHFEPAAPVTLGEAPRIATAYYSIVHDAPDNDLFVKVGVSLGRDPESAQFFTLGKGEAGQDSFSVDLPTNAATATLGTIDHFWSIGLFPQDNVGPYLPPSNSHPWFLNVTEGGYVNRTGRLTGFSIFVNDSLGSASGTTYITDSITPLPTIETMQSTLWIPERPATLAAGFLSIDAQAVDAGIRVSIYTGDSDRGSAVVIRGTNSDASSGAAITAKPLSISGAGTEYVDTDVEAGTAYWYWVTFTDLAGRTAVAGPVAVTAAPHGFRRTILEVPAPNPLTSSSRLRFTVGGAAAGAGATAVSLTVHDGQGRIVRTLVDRPLAAGDHEQSWDGHDDEGRVLPTGVYYVLLRTGPETRSTKVVVLR